MHRRHLQEIPDSGSNVTTSFTWAWDPSKTSELLLGMGVSVLNDKLANENTPQELLICVSPPPKRQKVKDKEFVLARRPRLLREAAGGVSWDTLPDELLLGIFSYLTLADLLKVSQVCRRWHRLSMDESLWKSLDLTGRNLLPGVIGQLLPLGVTAFRCPRSCVGNPLFKTSRKIAQNPSLMRLNLSGCSGFCTESLEAMLNSCSRLEELNLAWCDFTVDHVRTAVSHIPSTVIQLNLSGYRQNLLMSDVKTLLERCHHLVHLDLSDSVMLKPECFQYFCQLTYLEHLSLSRCYQIPPAALLELGEISTLKTLQVFGIVTPPSLQLLKATLPHIKINSSHFTTIARPTTGYKKNQEMWGIQCRLSLRHPAVF
ncbi:S-phase kinase-associated protein 2 isoform X2 [Paroedura picta]|uniref:S-phase kinase-associated protein 2 isoform X2 n=1 Tax=Paroedura picta TaxID=143630 RepID=UPI0040565C27